MSLKSVTVFCFICICIKAGALNHVNGHTIFKRSPELIHRGVQHLPNFGHHVKSSVRNVRQAGNLDTFEVDVLVADPNRNFNTNTNQRSTFEVVNSPDDAIGAVIIEMPSPGQNVNFNPGQDIIVIDGESPSRPIIISEGNRGAAPMRPPYHGPSFPPNRYPPHRPHHHNFYPPNNPRFPPNQPNFPPNNYPGIPPNNNPKFPPNNNPHFHPNNNPNFRPNNNPNFSPNNNPHFPPNNSPKFPPNNNPNFSPNNNQDFPPNNNQNFPSNNNPNFLPDRQPPSTNFPSNPKYPKLPDTPNPKQPNSPSQDSTTTFGPIFADYPITTTTKPITNNDSKNSSVPGSVENNFPVIFLNDDEIR